MMLTDEQLESIEAQNELAKEVVAKGEAFKRLLENDDYKLIIMEGYLHEHPKTVGEAIATNTGEYDEDQLIIDLKATNSFIRYGIQLAQAHMGAEQTLRSNAEVIANQSEDEEA